MGHLRQNSRAFGKAPKRYSDSDIDGQFYFAIGSGITSVVLLMWMFRVRARHWILVAFVHHHRVKLLVFPT